MYKIGGIPVYIQDELPLELKDDVVAVIENLGEDQIGPIYLLANSCPACATGDHYQCRFLVTDDEGNHECCCPTQEVGEDSTGKPTAGPTVVEQIKAASEVTDVTSTGRKRAALAYPITEGMICEWAGLAKAGGGVIPIIGCNGNLATDIHHGPDKNTLNNTPENVHRICAKCHNRTHALNDPFYGKRPSGSEPFIPLDGYAWVAHNSEDKATDEQIVNSELYWATPRNKRRIEYGSLRGEDTPKVREEV